MYLTFFGLNDKPFAITPDPRYLYLSERHAEALAHLLYGVNEAGGFIQLTGEVGTGKTTVIRSLLAQTPRNAEIALILNPRMTAPEFLLTLCEELGIGVPDSAAGSLKDLVDILSHYLLRAHSGGKRIVLVVDEAQNLAPEVLEQVRLLTNLETNTQKLLQIILIGQPELRELLGRNELRQLAQRVTGRYHLNPLSKEETAAYVRHRLRVAGATSDIFSSFALAEVHRLAGGVPRLINVLCDRALLGAYTQDRHHVSRAFVRRGAMEVFGRHLAPWWLPWAAAAATVVLLAGGGLAVWKFSPWLSAPAAARPAAKVAASAARPAASVPGGAGQPVAAVAGGTAVPAASGRESTAAPVAGAPGSTGPGSALAAAVVRGPAADPETAPVLGRLLAGHPAQTAPDAAFGRLFALWGGHYRAGGADPCTQAAQQGLECYVQKGSLAQLRLYNRPAILMLNDDAGGSHQVVLTGLEGKQARVDIGGTPARVGLADLSHHWPGDFILLWRPATPNPKPLSPGMRGAQVRRLRQDLQRALGTGVATDTSDVYDAGLSQLVRDFQRSHRLTADGVAGVQTLVVLNSATAGADSPQLAVPPSAGS